jgi:hypothetical protein
MNLLEMLLRGRYGFEAGMLSLAALLVRRQDPGFINNQLVCKPDCGLSLDS